MALGASSGSPAAGAASSHAAKHAAVAMTPARGTSASDMFSSAMSIKGATSQPAAVHHSAGSDGRLAVNTHRNTGPTKPYLIYDSVTPNAIPAHHVIATYANGNYAIPASQMAGHGRVLWIDTTGGDPNANVLDVEPGDATPAQAAHWAYQRLTTHPGMVARIYTMRSEWPAIKAAVSKFPPKMQARIHWWIADPTGVPHIVPGAGATQWYWGSSYDITTANPHF